MPRLLYILLLLSGFCDLRAQSHEGPVARFSFNNKDSLDEVTGFKPKRVNVKFTQDRFGNPNNALYLYGNEYSYLNLGNYDAVKPRAGSISIWAKMGSKVWSGWGYLVNPIILAKCHGGDDFFEAYGINYAITSDVAVVNCSRDSLRQVVLPLLIKFDPYEWHHFVLSFDNHFITFYIDGELQARQVKNFETVYLAGDSVMVGATANKKNNRYFAGSVDDIEFYDRVLSDEEVKELYESPNPNRFMAVKQNLLRVLWLIVLLALVYVLTRWQLSKAQKKERERLELTNKLLETELRVNRGLMNPHFIYNSLYSAQSFVLNNENERANNYLVKFSRLLRKLLENNMSDTISLEAEIDLLSSFVEIENLKLDQPVEATIETPGISSLHDLYIPVMMIQPFVENAIWHGLKARHGERRVHIRFEVKDEKYIECVVEDNGIGRKASAAVGGSGSSSLAIVFIKTRIDLLNKIYQLHCSLHIIDKPNGTGTIIRIILPLLNKRPAGMQNAVDLSKA